MTTIAAFLCLIFILDGLRLRGRARSLAPLPDSDRPVRADHRFLFPEGFELSEETKRAASRYADAAGLEVLDLVPADYPGTDLLGLLELVDPNTYRGQPFLPARPVRPMRWQPPRRVAVCVGGPRKNVPPQFRSAMTARSS